MLAQCGVINMQNEPNSKLPKGTLICFHCGDDDYEMTYITNDNDGVYRYECPNCKRVILFHEKKESKVEYIKGCLKFLTNDELRDIKKDSQEELHKRGRIF